MTTAWKAFCVEGTPVAFKQFDQGHINRTVRLEMDSGREYVLQKINTYVFRDPVHLMENAAAVTSYLRLKSGDLGAAIHFIPTKDGKFYYIDEDGFFWRMYDFVGGYCMDRVERPEDFYQSALAFGRFQNLLADFPADTLYETIPEFHNTPDRYRQLREAAAKDAMGRLAGVEGEMKFLLDREEEMGALQRMRESGELPLRVTHNDTKLNNVLLDRETKKPLCVLDLDTVMPGLSAYDFGDSIRYGAATAAEDEPDPGKMKLDLTLFEAYTRGFLEACPSLTPMEVQVLPLGAKVMTMECAVRFLADYLNGDVYFNVNYPTHNLVRARTQMALTADMERKWEQMNEIVARVAHEVRGA